MKVKQKSPPEEALKLLYGGDYVLNWRSSMDKRSGENLTLSTEGEIRTAVELYNKVVSLYQLKGGRKAGQRVKKWATALNQIEEPQSLIDTIKLYFDQMVKELGGEVPPFSGDPDKEGPQYVKKTLNDHRTEALKEHLETSGKKSLKSSEAKIVLETIERKTLSRSQVLRSLKNLPNIVHGACDKIGGRCEVRFIIKSPEFFSRQDYSKLIRLGS